MPASWVTTSWSSVLRTQGYGELVDGLCKGRETVGKALLTDIKASSGEVFFQMIARLDKGFITS